MLNILPIPFGNTPPALSSVLIGAGIFMNDRWMILAGFAAGFGVIVFTAAMGAGIWQLGVLALQ